MDILNEAKSTLRVMDDIFHNVPVNIWVEALPRGPSKGDSKHQHPGVQQRDGRNTGGTGMEESEPRDILKGTEDSGVTTG